MFMRKFMMGVGVATLLSTSPMVLASKTAYDVYSNLSEEGVTYIQNELKVEGGYLENFGGIVSYGAEKEGVSSNFKNHKVVLVAGPDAETFRNFVVNIGAIKGISKLGLSISMSKEARSAFLRVFLDRIYKRDQGISEVTDKNGHRLSLNYSQYSHLEFFKMKDDDIYKIFQSWLSQTHNRPFSFISPKLRKKIFLGELVPEGKDSSAKWALKGHYEGWLPLYGVAEKYITKVVPMTDYLAVVVGGWELNFMPQKTYGGFEEMMRWLSDTWNESNKKDPLFYKGAGGDEDYLDDVDAQNDLIGFFNSPGHQRLVWPKPITHHKEDKEHYKQKMAEIFKNIQAYIVLQAMSSGMSIETGMWKRIHSDDSLTDLKTWKGPIRLEKARFGEKHTMGIEIRAGMKDSLLQRMIQKVIASRVATNDWTGITNADHWKLFSRDIFHDLKKTAHRFNVSKDDLKTFIELATHKDSKKVMRRLVKAYLVPLWYWENAPFLDQNKKMYIKNLTHDMIMHVVKQRRDLVTSDEIISLIHDWIKHTKLARDIEYYLVPQHPISFKESWQEYPYPAGMLEKYRGMVDVNKIDFGIEYTGQYPVKRIAKFTSTSPARWLETTMDLTPKERVELFRRVSTSLCNKLFDFKERGDVFINELPNFHSQCKTDEWVHEIKDEAAHGHGLSITFKVKDPFNRGSWKVEWDGIGRSYHSNGKPVEGSFRGGHIELVTPKFKPSMADIMVVFSTFKANSLVPSHHNGGGHVNIDLAPFDGKPHQLARFMAYFHKYQNIIAMMFQHPTRLKAAQPFDVRPEFQRQLADFKGTEVELKKLLYNEGYFNHRIGRKSRYLQLNMTAYYQDVIPKKLVTHDFDIKNPTVLWHPQVKANPVLRKMELRLMNAPETAYESAMQIRLVRALINRAINYNDPIVGDAQVVDFDQYVGSPEKTRKAQSDLKALVDDLGLRYEDYNGLLFNSINYYEIYRRSNHYRSLAERLEPHQEYPYWGTAEDARPTSGPGSIDSEAVEGYDQELNNYEAIREYQQEELVGLDSADEERYIWAQRKASAMLPGHDPLSYFVRPDSGLGLQDPSYYVLRNIPRQ